MIVTTLHAWRAAGDRLPIDDEHTVRVPDDDSALSAADALPGGSQVLVLPEAGAGDRREPDGVRWARRGPAGHHTELLHRPATAASLDLLPHPEGGWFRETWRSAHSFVPDGYPGPRSAATAILFLLPPRERSIRHAVRSDELWMWHRGGPLELGLSGAGETPGDTEIVLLGPDLARGHRVQQLVPAGTWQEARPHGDDEVLVSCVVAPGFDFEDFRS